MRAVEIAEPNVVESEIVLLSQACGAFTIFPNPISKAILQLLLLFARGHCFRLIYDAVSVYVLIVGCGCAPIQRLLNQVGRTETGGAMGRGVANDVLCAIVEIDCPGRDSLGVANFHARAR